jgi:hypothetical protein
VSDVDSEGPLAAASMGVRGLLVIDMSVPTSPTIAATLSGLAWNVDVQGMTAAYGTGDIEGPGFVLVDLTNPASPFVLSAAGHP